MINFPDNPTLGEIYPPLEAAAIDGRRWRWTGSAWSVLTIEKATEEEALAGTSNEAWMTPLRTAQAIAPVSARIDYLTENLDPAALDSIAEAAASIGAIQTQLDEHTHTAADITDFASAVVASAPALAITASTRIADGTATTFPVSGIVSNDPAHVLVALNGVTQAPGTDYTVSEASGTITFDAPPTAGTQIACTALGLRSVQPPIDPTLYLFAFDSSTDGLTTYSGRLLNADRPAAPALPETATTWTINRATLNAAGRVTSTATATGSWANRESLSFQ